LKPKNSAAIEAEQAAMERRSSELSILRTRIESSSVNSYSSQMAINQYNGLVDQYNSLLTSYQADSAGLKMKINQFNAQVSSYNSYLTSNCSRR
jgi:hypothetical protein